MKSKMWYCNDNVFYNRLCLLANLIVAIGNKIIDNIIFFQNKFRYLFLFRILDRIKMASHISVKNVSQNVMSANYFTLKVLFTHVLAEYSSTRSNMLFQYTWYALSP